MSLLFHRSLRRLPRTLCRLTTSGRAPGRRNRDGSFASRPQRQRQRDNFCWRNAIAGSGTGALMIKREAIFQSTTLTQIHSAVFSVSLRCCWSEALSATEVQSVTQGKRHCLPQPSTGRLGCCFRLIAHFTRTGQQGHRAVVSLLLKHKANVNYVREIDGGTPLIRAARVRRSRAVQRLQGRILNHIARRWQRGDADIVLLLLRAGANVAFASNRGVTARDAAYSAEHQAVVDIIDAHLCCPLRAQLVDVCLALLPADLPVLLLLECYAWSEPRRATRRSTSSCRSHCSGVSPSTVEIEQ